jgi:hypothetical protein
LPGMEGWDEEGEVCGVGMDGVGMRCVCVCGGGGQGAGSFFLEMEKGSWWW